MKSWMYILIFILTVGVIGSVILYNARTINDIETETVTIGEIISKKQLDAEDGGDMEKGDVIYKNSDLGFRLTMTEKWSDYTITGTTDNIQFCVFVPETIMPYNPVCFFGIVAIDADKRDQEIEECEKNDRWMEEDCYGMNLIRDRELGRENGKIFVYVMTNDPGREKEKPFVDDIEKILKSFQVSD